jgi:hypothetical protein
MMKLSKICMFVVFLYFGCKPAFAEPECLRLPFPQAIHNLEEINKKNVVRMKGVIGRISVAKLLNPIQLAYSNYRIVSYCLGSFDGKGNFDFGFAIVNTSNPMTGAYIALIENKNNNYDLVKLLDFEVRLNNRGVLSEQLEVHCRPWTEAYRMTRKSGTLNEEQLSKEPRNATNVLDRLCILPPESPENQLECFSYDATRRNFEMRNGDWPE